MSPRLKKLFIFALVAIAIFFTTYHLTESPSVWYDEGEFFQLASNVAHYGISGLQIAPDQITHIPLMTIGYPPVYPLSILFRIFGESVLLARSLMVLFILAFVTVGYFLSKRLFGQKIAICSLALLVTFPPLYANGKSFIGEVPGVFFAIAALLIFDKARFASRRKVLWYAFAGLLLGLCVATKPIYLVFLPAAGVALLIEWWRKRVSIRESVCFGAGVSVPIIIWLILQFGSLPIFFSVMNFYSNPYEATSMSALLVNNLKLLVTSPGPLYLVLMVLTWSLALFSRKMQKKDIGFSELSAYFATILFLGSYLHVTGWFRYLFPAQAIALVFFPASMLTLLDWIGVKFTNIAKWRRIILGTIIGLLSAWGVYGLLFNSWVAEFYNSDKTAFWESYFMQMPEGKSVLFYDTPEIAIFSRSRNYYQYLEPAGGPFGKEQLTKVENGSVDKIILEKANFEKHKELFSRHYHLDREIYKYSILERNPEK